MRRYHALIFFFSGSLWAYPFQRDVYRDIRWLGRGNTGIAAITDGSALFYNPAGLGANQDYHFDVFNPNLGAGQNILTSTSQALSVASGGSQNLGTQLAPFLGQPLSLEGGLFPNIALPHFAAGFWDTMAGTIEYRNPVNPEFDVQGTGDYGLIMGFGYGFWQKLFVGMSLRYQTRKEINTVISGATALTATPSLLTDLVQRGVGWGMDFGLQYHEDLGPLQWGGLGLTIEDVGNTTFVTQTGGVAPNPQRQMINAGLAYGVDSPFMSITLLGDMRRINDFDLSTTKKVFLGSEVNLFIGDFRGGFYQGYWTAGLTVHMLPVLDLDFSSYAEELDSAAGLTQNRIWMVGLRMRLDVSREGSGKVKKQKALLDQIGSG